ncbi:MAG: VCBS repeat-containing protein [Phycisphaerae bacterium]|nr:VCBS repeat-containing protein [Phycisphaerae bacterium]
MRRLFTTAVLASSTFAASLLTQDARGDFVGYEADNYAASAGGDAYQVIDVYAVFTSPTDRLLNIFDVDLFIDDALTTNFYQASVPAIWPASGLPAVIILDADAFAYDTFVTIGALQGDLSNGTLGDPSFNDALFLATGELNPPAGWYNLPGSNGHGDAGGDLRVLVGRFTIEDQFWQSGAKIWWTATVGYIGDVGTAFSTQSRPFYFPTVAVPQAPLAEDFDNDGKGDIIWHAPGSNTVRFWKLDGVSLIFATTLSGNVPGTWTAQGSGDFDGDGDPDMLFRTSTGDFVIQFVENEDTTTTETVVAGVAAAWQCVAIGDVDVDGRADLVFRNTTTKEIRLWLMDGAIRWRMGSLGFGGTLQFVTGCDLDGNGSMDLVWRTPAGQVQVWLLDGFNVLSSGAVSGANNVPLNWSVVSNGDLNGDSHADLVWRNNDNGNVNGWLMSGATKIGGGLISPNVAAAWIPVASLDTNGDGDDDLVWRNVTTGVINVWNMNGLTKLNGASIGTVPSAWKSLTQ